MTNRADEKKRFEVLTLFPELFTPFRTCGLIGKGIEKDLLSLETVPLRAFGMGKHRKVDDSPYGGGAGMVLRPEPLFSAIRSREAEHKEKGQTLHRILVTPQGETFSQAKAAKLAKQDATLLFICGRYEGFDERIRTGCVDEEISLGDFVTLGGETAAMAMIEAIARLVPGVLGNPESPSNESFSDGMLEYPQFTRPPDFEGMAVPDVLISGNHEEIKKWRKAQALSRTSERRPDLLKN